MAKSAAKVDPKSSANKEQSPVERWIDELENAKKNFKSWWESCDKVVSRYEDERKSGSTGKSSDRRYNILWSVIQTLQPLVYSDAPTPYVSRRYNDRDPVARDASLILQRALTYTLEGDELNDALTEARDDYLLTSRGVIWHKYTPYLQLRASDTKERVEDGDEVPDDVEVQEDDQGKFYYPMVEEKVYEECDVEHVLYTDFLHGPAAKWRHVPWVARRVAMTRAELVKRFGEKMGRQPPLNLGPKGETSSTVKSDDEKGISGRAEVWEIWDRHAKKVMWLCPAYTDSFLDEQDDILGLDGFFPCTKPAYGTKTNKSLVPIPDYKMWQDIAMELDDVTLRISLLTDALRVAGVYDAQAGPTLKKLLTQTKGNELIPVSNWALFAERGGLKGAIEFVPIDQIMIVLEKLHQARQRLVQELYEITGISDIIRGASDPRETAKAQQIKGNFANKRLKLRQKEIMRMARESLEIMTQIICSLYSDDMIREISSAEQIVVNPITKQFDPARFQAALQLIRNAPLRKFRIKIDERSLSEEDMLEDRESRVQFLGMAAQYLGTALPMAKELPATVPLLTALLGLGVRGFPIARSVEAQIEETLEMLASAPVPQDPVEAPAGPTGKSPDEIAVEREKNSIAREKVGIDRQRLLMDERFKALEHQLNQMRLNVEAMRAERDAAIKEAKVVSDVQSNIAQREDAQAAREHDAQLQREQMDQNAVQHQSEMAARAFMKPKAKEMA